MEDETILSVRNVYLEIGRASLPSDGACRFFYEDAALSQIVCGAKIDEGDRRTEPIVTFEAAAPKN
jgi:Zn finger protein HypA/HybF involved in hydrogenase expression